MNDTIMQYKMAEFAFKGHEPEGSFAQADVKAVFSHNGEETEIYGFYAGNGVYKVRFLPEQQGRYDFKIAGEVSTEGSFTVEAHDDIHHGIVHTEGTHLRYSDGTLCTPFGTTVYAMLHQDDSLIKETLESLRKAPFDKIRLCLFPKDYDYNKNAPEFYPFERTENGWNVHHPDFRFWDRFESYLEKLFDMGVQVDLILFHPYDRWGFAKLGHKDDLVYLDYLIRRFSAYPNIWWSMANEYDLCFDKTDEDWYDIEQYISSHDRYHHLLSNHHCIVPWDHSRKLTTHVSMQTSRLERIAEYRRRYKKPVLIDECCYEGDLTHMWGNLSGQEMTARFWKSIVQGAYCTHGETYLNDREIIFWSRGGTLKGSSIERISFLKNIVTEFNAPIEPLEYGLGQYHGYTDDELRLKLSENAENKNPFLLTLLKLDRTERDRWLETQYEWAGHCDDSVFIYYFYSQCKGFADITLPENKKYHIDVVDTWEMTRNTVLNDVSGKVRVPLPAKEYIALIAVETMY